jgi:uncharacterized ion transporter superfamily protein YfcC
MKNFFLLLLVIILLFFLLSLLVPVGSCKREKIEKNMSQSVSNRRRKENIKFVGRNNEKAS